MQMQTQMQHDDEDAPTEETMVGFFRDLATKCHAYYDPLPIASNTYPYMPREEYTHLIGHSKATSRVKAIGRVLAAHPEIVLVSCVRACFSRWIDPLPDPVALQLQPNPLILKEYHAKHPLPTSSPLNFPPTAATVPASGRRKGPSPHRFLLPATTATKRSSPDNRRPTAAEREAAALNGAKTVRFCYCCRSALMRWSFVHGSVSVCMCRPAISSPRCSRPRTSRSSCALSRAGNL